jgi:hypothetical protein
MAARYTPTQLNAFKRTLLARLPACFFTAADVDQLQKETGVDSDRIQRWVAKVCKRVLAEDRESYLPTIDIGTTIEIDCDKVHSPSANAFFFVT